MNRYQILTITLLVFTLNAAEEGRGGAGGGRVTRSTALHEKVVGLRARCVAGNALNSTSDSEVPLIEEDNPEQNLTVIKELHERINKKIEDIAQSRSRGPSPALAPPSHERSWSATTADFDLRLSDASPAPSSFPASSPSSSDRYYDGSGDGSADGSGSASDGRARSLSSPEPRAIVTRTERERILRGLSIEIEEILKAL